MNIFKILGISLITVVMSVILKETKPEFSVFITIAGGVVILFMVVESLSQSFQVFNQILDSLNIDKNIFKTLLKIIGIGYLTEFASSLCKDMQNTSIADKIIFSGKIIIFGISLPIFQSIIEIVVSLL